MLESCHLADTRRGGGRSLLLRGLTVLCISGLAGCVTLGEPTAATGEGQCETCATCAAPAACASCGAPNGPTHFPAPQDAAWNGNPLQPQAAPPACMPLDGAAAVPDLAVARATRECEERIAELQARIDQLSDENREVNMVRDQQMKRFFGELQTLNDEVSFWKAEVQRLDTEAQAQHTRDMQSLDALIELVGQIPVAASSPGAQTPSSGPARN